MTRQNRNRFAMRIVLAVSLISSVQANASIEDADRAIKAARYADGIAELRRLTAAGNARAEAKLGWMTLMGIGLPRDPAKAQALITHAADTGDRSAQLVLAAMLITSASDAGNDAQAERILRKLAEQGDAQAQAQLGQLYVFGRGCRATLRRRLTGFSDRPRNTMTLGSFCLARYMTREQACRWTVRAPSRCIGMLRNPDCLRRKWRWAPRTKPGAECQQTTHRPWRGTGGRPITI